MKKPGETPKSSASTDEQNEQANEWLSTNIDRSHEIFDVVSNTSSKADGPDEEIQQMLEDL